MHIPLSEKLRPISFKEVVGQDHLVSDRGYLTEIVKNKKPLSILLWGPPGCGKTTIAKLYAKAFDAHFVMFSAVMTPVSEIKKEIQKAQENPLFHRALIIFIDEIHRFNKAQQDLFLPLIENGTIIFIGATTENPSFTLNNALLSRLRVLTLKSLEEKALFKMITKFETTFTTITLTDPIKKILIDQSQGDGRHLLNLLENIVTLKKETLDEETLYSLIQRRPPAYDRHAEMHFNLISALHKSIRGSDPDSALYYLARMLKGGEDPQYLLRRLSRMASEDIGLADPFALSHVMTAWEAFQKLGSPEGELIIAGIVIYLALAPKSNALYLAFKKATKTAEKTSHLNPPLTILNAPTQLMEKIGYGQNYQYDHDEKDGFSGQNYFPEELGRESYYQPRERGFEREMSKRLKYFKNLRQKKTFKPSSQSEGKT